MRILTIYLLCLFCLFANGCKDSKTQDSNEVVDLKNEKWLFNTQYIKTINESSWERVSISALNNYRDFKIDFSFISTGKPQTCGLYAKGVLVNAITHKTKNTIAVKKFLLRPNLIPDITIWITYNNNKKDANTSGIKLEISDMVHFIEACGDAHQYVIGEYDVMQ